MRTECLKHFTEQFAYPAEARDSLLRDYAARVRRRGGERAAGGLHRRLRGGRAVRL